jgi:hypothetical protein
MSNKAIVQKGQIFEAKKPKLIGFMQHYNDREVIHVSDSRCLMGHLDKGYSPEFTQWCSEHRLRQEYSLIDQMEFEKENCGKEAKLSEPIWDYCVQYDSPSVKNGKRYPTISQSEFMKWAGKEVTKEMPPNGNWRMRTTTSQLKQPS